MQLVKALNLANGMNEDPKTKVEEFFNKYDKDNSDFISRDEFLKGIREDEFLEAYNL